MKKVCTLERDIRKWYAISCPLAGLRFDRRTLELLDADGDGHIRTPEVLAAIEYLAQKGVAYEALFQVDPEDEKRLSEVTAKQADLQLLAPTEGDKAALQAWEEQGAAPEVAVLGEATKAAEAALTAVETAIERFFDCPDDMPLVTEEADSVLPLRHKINPKYQEAVQEFAAKCVVPLLGERDELSRLEWKRVKAALAPYRAWVKARPVMNAAAKATLDAEEKFLRFKLYLGEFIRNYVTMDGLYSGKSAAIFQCGSLRIDAREMNLCFHVENEAAHSALVAKSNCCVLYLKLSRPSENQVRNVCAVITAGTIARLYAGRNGVFYDRDGLDWEATVTKVVESQVSLREAFWLPWKKLGEGISQTAKKFLGDKQNKAIANVSSGAKGGEQGGAAMASSVAAIGIAAGMLTAAVASVMTALAALRPWWMVFVAVLAIMLAVSLPSVILTYLKLRRRDIGAILNAGGWAVNRRMRISMRLAKLFTKCA